MLYFLLLLHTAPSLNAQYLDSLLSVWNDTTQTDSIRVNAYVGYLRDAYLFKNPDTVVILAQDLVDYAEKSGYRNAAGKGYLMQGNAYLILGNYPQALDFYQKSLTIWQEVGDKRGGASVLSNMALIYFRKGANPRALEYSQRSLEIQEEIGDKKGMSSTLSTIGNLYSTQGDSVRALEYYERSLHISEEIEDKKGVGGSMVNIGTLYQKSNDPVRALEYYQTALLTFEEIGDENFTGITLNNIAMVYQNMGDSPQALEYAQRSLSVRQKLGDQRGISRSIHNIGTIYRSMGKFDLALKNCGEALDLAEAIGSLDLQKFACDCLYDTYKDMGKGAEALVYLEKANVIKDSLQVLETAKKLEQMEFAKVMQQDSIAKAEEARLVEEAHQAEVSQKNKTRNVLIGSSLLLLLLAGGLYGRWRNTHRSRAVIAKERERSDNLLHNILPEEIAAELKEKGRADARDFDMVSIIFTDFKGFTEHSTKLSAADLVEEINHCFQAFDNIMGKYGIEKIKTIGDAYMAAGGLPVPSETSVKNTVLAAMEMQDFIKKRKAEKDAKGELAFEMRVGIHTGPVVAGIVGVKKFQYDIWGDTVNTASRMESSGEVGRVNISQSTYDLLKDKPDLVFEHRGKVRAKGKGEVDMYFCERA